MTTLPPLRRPDVAAVLFDFSGTLCRVEPAERWVGAVMPHWDAATRAVWAERLEHAGALPGGRSPAHVPAHLAADWADRDLGPDAHRRAYTGLTRLAGWPDPGTVDVLYDRSASPAAWDPYPDAAETLTALAERGIPRALVSNIGWDPRPVLAAHGLLALLDAVVLSYEVGVCKPDARIFAAACRALGVDPGRTLMVGDDPVADRGGEAIGVRTRLVAPTPVADGPHGLLDVLTGPDGSPGDDRPAGA